VVEAVPIEPPVAKLERDSVALTVEPLLVSVPRLVVLPRVMFGVLMVVVAPAVVAPRLMVVAAPKALMVVAVVLKRSKLLEPVRRLVVMVGLVPKTSAPLPVSSVITPEMPDDAVVAVNADVPLPRRRPVNVDAPVPPFETGIWPVRETLPDALRAMLPDADTAKVPDASGSV